MPIDDGQLEWIALENIVRLQIVANSEPTNIGR